MIDLISAVMQFHRDTTISIPPLVFMINSRDVRRIYPVSATVLHGNNRCSAGFLPVPAMLSVYISALIP